MRFVVCALAGALVVAGCTDGRASAPTLPLDEQPARRLVPGEVEDAEELAESQLTAITAAAPELPPLCEAGLVETWTARALVGDASADSVLRLRNVSDVECEISVGASPFVHPAIEPDVWLEPGDWADLVVGPAADDCDDPAPVYLADLDINGEQVVVPTAAVAACGWRLTAFYEVERPESACAASDLDARLVGDHVLVRNSGFRSCTLGESIGPAPEMPAAPPITDLAPGDVIAWPVWVLDDCVGASTELAFEAVVVTYERGDRCVEVAGGPGRAYFGPDERPLRDVEPFDVARALVALDPFGT